MVDCQSCHVKMMRVDVAQPSPTGVVATFECPQCHARVQGKG